jgi:ribosomal protein L40E
MAFCPNCGTPNTEQAERCVACGYELIVPKQKAKFKGTIMMSGIKAPAAAQPEPPPAPPPPAAKSSIPPPAAAATPPKRNLNYQKTMMGQPPIVLPSKPEPAKAEPAKPASAPPPDLGTMPTMQGNAPIPSLPPFSQSNTPQSFAQPSLPPTAANNTREFQPDLALSQPMRPQSPAPSSPTPSSPTPKPSPSTYGGATFAGGKPSSPTLGAGRPAPIGGAYESTMPPAAPPNPAKVIAVGCGVVLALFLVVGGVLWFAFGDRIKALFGGETESGSAEAAAWHASIAQSLTKVNELCQSDCGQAGVFFHPLKQNTLIGEARALTAARVAKLNDPANSTATMLDRTDDASIATQLGLDPQQCARVVAGGAKVISCSVPDPGKPSVLRIVALSGISTL